MFKNMNVSSDEERFHQGSEKKNSKVTYEMKQYELWVSPYFRMQNHINLLKQ